MGFFSTKNERNERDERHDRIFSEIESIRVRKDTAISVYQKELMDLQKQKDTIISNIGKMAYDKYLDHEEITGELFETFWEDLDCLSKKIEMKKQKQNEIISRYDEEIEMMNKEINYMEDGNVVGYFQICPNCKAKIAGSDLFCEKCGTKLDK